MKKKTLTDKEKLNGIYNWAVAVQSVFLKQKEEIVRVSRTEMIEKLDEVIQVTKGAL